MVGMMQCFSLSDVEQKQILLKERQVDISEVMSEVQQKESQKTDIIQKIERLQDELAKRKESKLIFNT